MRHASVRLAPILTLASLGRLRRPDSLRESVRPWPPSSGDFQLLNDLDLYSCL
jgi:hypothetical protein